MKSEVIIKKMQAKDYKETCVLLESLPEFVDTERKEGWEHHKSVIRFFLLIDRFSGEWNIRYEEVKEDDFLTAPESIICVSDLSLLDALRKVHKQLKKLMVKDK